MTILKIKVEEYIGNKKTQCPTKLGQKITLYVDQKDKITLTQVIELVEAAETI